MATLNLVGDFPNPWPNPIDEAKRIEAWTWAPATDSWRAVIGADTNTISSFSQFLGAIEKQKPGSIERLNFFSHGNRGLLACSGNIEKTTGNVMLNTSTAIDLRIRDTEPIPLGNGKLQETLGGIAYRLRNRFSPKGQIVLYLCNSGLDLELIQEVANAFGVKTSGFAESVYVCPEWPRVPGQAPRINRGFTSLDRCRNKKPGFLHLAPTVTRTPATGSISR